MKEILTIRGLSKSRRNYPALSKTSFSLYEGRIIGVTGAASSGKSLLLRMAAGLARPDSGSIELCSEQLCAKSKAQISYMPDAEFLPCDMKTAGIIKMYASLFGGFDTLKAADMMSSFGIDLNKRFGELSPSMKKQAQLAIALSRSARLYLLDEPFAGMTAGAAEYAEKYIGQKRGESCAVAIAMSSIGDKEELLDDCIVMQNGMVRIYDSVDELRQRACGMGLDEYFGEVVKCC